MGQDEEGLGFDGGHDGLGDVCRLEDVAGFGHGALGGEFLRTQGIGVLAPQDLRVHSHRGEHRDTHAFVAVGH